MKKIVVVIIILVLVAVGVIVIKNKKEALGQIPSMKEYAMVVESMKVEKKHTTLRLPYLATLKSEHNILLSSKISSRVEFVAKSGTYVKKGDIIVSLDKRDLLDKQKSIKLQINSSKAEIVAKKLSLLTAKQSHKRTQDLLEVEGASQESYERETSAIENIKASLITLKNKIEILNTNLSQIKTTLSYATLKANNDTFVSATFVNEGDMAMPGKPLMKLEAKGKKYLLVNSADTLNIKTLIYENKQYPLTELKSSLNSLHQYRADVQTKKNVDDRVNVFLIVYDDIGIKIPISGVLQKDGKNYCFLVEKNRTKPKEVKILARGQKSVIVDILKASDEIVIAKPDILLQLLAGKSIIIKNN